MKKFLVFSLLLLSLSGRTQNAYYAITVDGHMTFHNYSAYAYSCHLETRIKKTPIFLNWNFAFGMDSKMNFYGKANALTMLYKTPGYWDTPSSYSSTSDNRFGGILGLVLGPVLCPVGVTIYINEKHPKNKLGLYFNPLIAEYFDASKKVNSWTVETGFKFIRNTSEKTAIYLQCGVSYVTNMCTYRGADYLNGYHLGFAVGLAHIHNDEE